MRSCSQPPPCPATEASRVFYVRRDVTSILPKLSSTLVSSHLHSDLGAGTSPYSVGNFVHVCTMPIATKSTVTTLLRPPLLFQDLEVFASSLKTKHRPPLDLPPSCPLGQILELLVERCIVGGYPLSRAPDVFSACSAPCHARGGDVCGLREATGDPWLRPPHPVSPSPVRWVPSATFLFVLNLPQQGVQVIIRGAKMIYSLPVWAEHLAGFPDADRGEHSFFPTSLAVLRVSISAVVVLSGCRNSSFLYTPRREADPSQAASPWQPPILQIFCFSSPSL
ncbi:hypothetical protein B0H11DRAFT_2279283 [Mycena galericulata]|nr:hypothetical protein B0H11DRAFT_2279283 [Mycena galericulata]